MHLIYNDALQDDEDLCNILAALQLESHPTSVIRDPDTVVAQAARSTLNVCNDTPARRPSLASHDQPLAPITGPSGKYPPVHFISMCNTKVTDDLCCISAHMTSIHSRWGLQCIAGQADRDQVHMVRFFKASHSHQLVINCRRADAGDASQGVDGGKVAKINDSPWQHCGRRAAYVVFEGLAPGVYSSWYNSGPNLLAN